MFKVSRTEPYLRRVFFDMTPEDMRWLDKAVNSGYIEESIAEILDKANTGIYTIWRIGAEEGVLITYKEDTSLWVCYLSTSQFLAKIDKLEQELEIIGKGIGCTRMRLGGSRKALQRIYERRYKEKLRVYEKEW